MKPWTGERIERADTNKWGLEAPHQWETETAINSSPKGLGTELRTLGFQTVKPELWPKLPAAPMELTGKPIRLELDTKRAEIRIRNLPMTLRNGGKKSA